MRRRTHHPVPSTSSWLGCRRSTFPPARRSLPTGRRRSEASSSVVCPEREALKKKSFVTANRNVLDGVPAVAGAKLATEYSIGHRDNNGCLEATGPYTSYTTYRTFRLPAGTRASKVVAFYQRRLREQWTEAGGTTFERTFTRGEAYVAVRASDESLQLTARARGPVVIPPSPPPPPRPYGAQYPIATGYLDTTPEPMSYELEPGETCERISSGDVPSIIIPPTPGIRPSSGTRCSKSGQGRSLSTCS